jgi:Peptidase E
MSRKIVAIGGGENGRLQDDGSRNPYETAPMDLEIIRLTGKNKPNFLFLGHANIGVQEGYFSVMVDIYNKMYSCECRILHSDDLADRTKTQELINWADIIYVGGGNTRSMIELWKTTEFDEVLTKAYEDGKVMCGVSAGANCWFKFCSSDALQIEQNDPNAPLIKVDALGLVDGLFTPHCDEKDRLNHMKDLLQTEDTIGVAMSNCAAIVIVDDEFRIITSDASYHGIEAYGIKAYWENDEYVQEKIEQSNELKKLNDLLSKY